MTQKKTLVLGASTNPERYAHIATLRLLGHGHEVVLLGKQPGEVKGLPIETTTDKIPADIHTVTVYLSERNQKEYLEYLLALKPQRVIFNPGAENPAFEKELAAAGIDPVQACTLVMLSTGQY